jgi:opacity protein-like surface antigen
MLRRALLVTPILLAGCASPYKNPVIAGDWATVSDGRGPRVEAPAVEPLSVEPLSVATLPAETPADLNAATVGFTDLAPDSQMSPGMPPLRNRQRFSIKGGSYNSTEKGIDDGYIINLAWKRPTSDMFSSEVEIGYLDASGSANGVKRDLWSIPVMVNGRVDFPLGQKFEVYGGLGLGSFYYSVDAKTSGLSVSADGFLIGGDAYFGGGIHLGQSAVLGLEGKYYVTDNSSDLGGGLDAYVVLLTLGVER